MRDWGYAKDYVECMWLMLQQKNPEDYVIATGIQYSVRHFCELAFKEAGIEIEWVGENENEKGICKATKKVIIEVDTNYYRPAEVDSLLGDPTKAKTNLGWNPNRTSIEELVKIMMRHDLDYVKQQKKC
jgi:GDPmannose 4,6-dehydratase